MKQILLPTDGSDNARHAMRYAIALFGKTATYKIVNSWRMPHAGASVLVSLDAELGRESKELLAEEEAWFKKEFGTGFSIDTATEKGDLVAVLGILMEPGKDQMVVMGTKGSSGLAEVLIGSTTAAVIGNVKCPVIAVPPDVAVNRPKAVVFASDLERIEDIKVLTSLKDLVADTGAKLTILHVTEDWSGVDADEHAESVALKNFFTGAKLQFDGVNNQDVAEGINEYAASHDVEMIVMLARNHNFFAKMFTRSESKRVAMHANIPLLVLHEI